MDLKILGSGMFPSNILTGRCNGADLKRILKEVASMVDDKHFPHVDDRVSRACTDVAEVCERFIRYVGRRVAIKRAVDTGVPLEDDGIPVKGHVDSEGLKSYSADEINMAKEYFATKNPECGAVFAKADAEEYLLKLTGGAVTFDLLLNHVGVNPFTSLRTAPGFSAGLYYERDIWNALRSGYRRLLTMEIVNASRTHSHEQGWEA